jgi:hypothetical protein
VEDGEGEADGEQPFVLGDQDEGADARYCARLDMDTRVRRRLYETLLAGRCGRLRKLDGLPVGGKSSSSKKMVGGGEVNEAGMQEEDVVWLAMAEKGLVKAQVQVQTQSGKEERETAVVDRSGRWPAEDSFA